MYLSIIIPAYNEEKRIAKTLQEIDAYLKTKVFEYEVLVVSDGSTDATIQVVNDLKIPYVRIIDNKKNRGKGFVVKQGFTAAQGEYRLFTDADNATPIDQLEKFLPLLSEYDVMIASRVIKGANVENYQSFHRRILGKIYGIILKVIIGLFEIKDTQCGFKLLNRKAAQLILPKCRINSMAFDAEILVVSKVLGLKIKEIPVTWTDDKNSKVTFNRMAQMFFDTLKIRWNLIRGVYEKS